MLLLLNDNNKIPTMDLCKETIKLLKLSCDLLKGADKRKFMAETVKSLGSGGQVKAQRLLGWCRDTIRKGQHEIRTGITCIDNFEGRGRRPAEAHLPGLIDKIHEIVSENTQADPTLKSDRLYTKITAKEVRKLLVESGYKEEELPVTDVIGRKLNKLGYNLKRVQKVKPKKKIPETDAIFEQLKIVNRDSDEDKNTLRVSIDAKAVVKIGEFDRGGRSRVFRKANDHDFNVIGKTTPVGFLIPKSGDLDFYMVSSKVTSDCIVDLLQEWWNDKKKNFTLVSKLVLNLDNGPEQQSNRTQFMNRIQGFSTHNCIEIQLAYYPPYHSKYNPIERTFGILEQHWNGELLDSLDAVYGYAKSMTWKGIHPSVKIINKIYQTGVSVSKHAMQILNAGFERLKGLEKWFVTVRPHGDTFKYQTI